jgi:hypothetical protein
MLNNKNYNILKYFIDKNISNILTITLYSSEKIPFITNTMLTMRIDDLEFNKLYLFAIDHVQENKTNKYILYGEEK